MKKIKFTILKVVIGLSGIVVAGVSFSINVALSKSVGVYSGWKSYNGIVASGFSKLFNGIKYSNPLTAITREAEKYIERHEKGILEKINKNKGKDNEKNSNKK